MKIAGEGGNSYSFCASIDDASPSLSYMSSYWKVSGAFWDGNFKCATSIEGNCIRQDDAALVGFNEGAGFN